MSLIEAAPGTAAGHPWPAPAETGGGRTLERSVRRRLFVTWALLLCSALPFHAGYPTLVPIPASLGFAMPHGALVLALVFAISLNRRLLVRPNVVLTLLTLLAGLALVTGVRGTAALGGVVRPVRLLLFIAVLWLLTPWWGRRDVLLAKYHLGALAIVCGTVVAGLVLHPSEALRGGAAGSRLFGVLWPIPAPQVAAHAAMVAGMALVLWMAGNLRMRWAVLGAGAGVGLIAASHTRTALVGLVLGVAASALSLLTARRRVRRLLVASLIVAPMVVVALAPALSGWLTRDQSRDEIAGLSGRTQVWSALLNEPRSEVIQWLGNGLSNKSFEGLSIDSGWLTVYHEEGLVGIALVAGIVLVLLLAPLATPPGPHRALAVFLIVYCLVASVTEVGFGDASPYLLALMVVASLVVPGRRRSAVPAGSASAAPASPAA